MTKPKNPAPKNSGGSKFHLEFLTPSQKLAWGAFQQQDVLFLIGPAGVGKSHLATAFAINEILQKRKKRIILTRPIVESGESLGYLPGSFEEKVNPYMLPLYDCLKKLGGDSGPQKEIITGAVEVAPLAYMRGRSQPLDAKILTPTGYKLMGELKAGEYVVGANGLETKIEAIYPQGELDVYKIEFTDGVSVECSADHLWNTTTLYERRHKRLPTTKTTAEIAKKIKVSHAYNHQIPIVKPIEFDKQATELLVNPYVLGALIGDGNFHQKASVTLTSADDEVIERVERNLPKGLKINESTCQEKGVRQVRLVSEIGKNDLRKGLAELELLGKTSSDKFIPNAYKFASVSQRLELLRGLLDTDGGCFEQKGKRKPRVQFYSTSEKLAKDVAFLVHSLGGTASLRKRNFTEEDYHELKGRPVIHNHSVWVVGIRMLQNPFNLARKADKFVPLQPLRAIRSIEKTGRKNCQCIRVAAKDSLYITDHCIVTHNTFDDAVCIFDEAQNATKSQLKLFLSRFGKNSKIIVTGDPQQSDLRQADVPLVDVMRRLETVPGIEIVTFKKDSIVRHPLVAEILERLEE